MWRAARVATPTLHGTCLDSLDTPYWALHSDTLREDLGTRAKLPLLYCQIRPPAVAQTPGGTSSAAACRPRDDGAAVAALAAEDATPCLAGSQRDASRAPTSVRLFTGRALLPLYRRRKEADANPYKGELPGDAAQRPAGGTSGPGAWVCTRLPGDTVSLGDGRDRGPRMGTAAP